MPENSPPTGLPAAATPFPDASPLRGSGTLSSNGPLVAVLAGGGSRRFGRPKEDADLGGRPLVEYPVVAARAAGLPIVLAGGDPALADRLEVPHIPDEAGLAGPIAGLVSALRAAVRGNRPGVILLGADMPLYPAGLIVVVSNEAASEPSRALALRSPDGRLQTLGAFYPTVALERIMHTARGPDPSLRQAFEAAGGRTLTATSQCLVGCDLERAFLNVNTPEDLARVAALMG